MPPDPLECRAVGGPDGAITPTLTLYYISWPPLSQNPPSAPGTQQISLKWSHPQITLQDLIHTLKTCNSLTATDKPYQN